MEKGLVTCGRVRVPEERPGGHGWKPQHFGAASAWDEHQGHWQVWYEVRAQETSCVCCEVASQKGKAAQAPRSPEDSGSQMSDTKQVQLLEFGFALS